MNAKPVLVAQIDVHPMHPDVPHQCALCGTRAHLQRITGGEWQGGIVICMEHSFDFCFALATALAAIDIDQVEQARDAGLR